MSRSRLTLSLYSAAGADATRAATEALAKPAQASLTSLRVRSDVRREVKLGMTSHSLAGASCGRFMARRPKNLIGEAQEGQCGHRRLATHDNQHPFTGPRDQIPTWIRERLKGS